MQKKDLFGRLYCTHRKPLSEMKNQIAKTNKHKELCGTNGIKKLVGYMFNSQRFKDFVINTLSGKTI